MAFKKNSWKIQDRRYFKIYTDETIGYRIIVKNTYNYKQYDADGKTNSVELRIFDYAILPKISKNFAISDSSL